MSAVVYSLMSNGVEVDVDETKEKFSLNMVRDLRRGPRADLGWSTACRVEDSS